MWCCVTRATTTDGSHSPGCEAVAPPGSCPNHRIISHDADGLERWCDFCGKDAEGTQVKRGSGGWGT